MSYTIPLIHFVDPDTKLGNEWALKLVRMNYASNARSLLYTKNVVEIDQYATGDHDMTDYKAKMFKGAVTERGVNHDDNPNDRSQYVEFVQQEDLTGIDFEPLGILVQPLNSAIATIQKQPIEVVATAMDAAASTKRKNDRDMLRNKPKFEAELDAVAAKMGMDKFDVGGARHNARAVSEMPFGLDASDEGDLDLYFDLFYKLRPESAYETMLEEWAIIKDLANTMDLETRDIFYYGVCVNRSFLSDTTGMPDMEAYIHPKDMYVPMHCKRRDKSDAEFMYSRKRYSISEFYNLFGEDIDGLEELEKITTTWARSGGESLPNFGTNDYWNHKFEVIYMESKSVDCMNIKSFVNSSGEIIRKLDKMEVESKNHKSRFAQNTYATYWVPGTDAIFKHHRIDYVERRKGNEYYTPFTFNIWDAQKKSAVELCISSVKMAQRAFIKMQHCIIKSKPPGTYINLSFLSSAFESLKSTDAPYTMQKLLALFFHNNIMIGDSSNLSSNEANSAPFISIPGGVGRELEGYLTTINAAIQNIGRITGINEQLTGQSSTPEGLVGLQKLLINSSINAIHYASIAKRRQATKVYNHWAFLFGEVISQKGPGYRALIEIIGERKAELLDAVPEIAVHKMGLAVTLHQREEEKQRLKEIVDGYIKQGILSGAEALILERTANPKDQAALLTLIEKKKMKLRAMAEEQAHQRQMQIEQAKMQAQGQMMQMGGQIDIQKIQAKAEADAKLMQLAAQLGLNKDYVTGQIKRDLQDRRGIDQTQKNLATIQAHADNKAKGL